MFKLLQVANVRYQIQSRCYLLRFQKTLTFVSEVKSQFQRQYQTGLTHSAGGRLSLYCHKYCLVLKQESMSFLSEVNRSDFNLARVPLATSATQSVPHSQKTRSHR